MSKKKILVIDDEEVIGQSIEMNLEDTGKYDVEYCTQATKGLALAKQFEPDLIILDFIMPEMDGSEVASRIQGDPKTKNIPIVFLTAIATKDDNSSQGPEIGGQTILSKPITVDKLLEVIEEKI